MFGKHKTEVLVTGAGPVGMFTAAALSEQGVQVEVYDQDRRTARRSFALALHPRSLKLFDEIGVAQKLISLGNKVERMAFYEGGDRKAELDFSHLESEFPFLLVVPQNVIEDVLQERLQRGHVKVSWSHRLHDLEAAEGHLTAEVHKLDHVVLGYPYPAAESVITKTNHVETQFLVGADGYHSRARRLADLDYANYGDAGTFFVTEFDTEEDVEPEVRVAMDEETTNVCWPITSRRARWSFQVDPSKDERPKETDLERFIRERAPWFTARPSFTLWSTLVHFERRMVDRFGNGRIWLVGDAAHLAGPVGVQSMNAGFREGRDLSARLAAVLHSGAPMSELETYHEECTTRWRGLLGLDRPTRVETESTDWVVERCDRIRACVPASGEEVDALMEQVGLGT